MKACIINIGNELLDGKIRNGNAEFIMQELGTIGVPVERQMIVLDDESAIIEALELNSDKDLILTTGGLGTTDDDKTRATVEKYLKDNNIKYEEIAMDNKYGYFDGAFYKYGKGGIMIFPGPPREMNNMLRNSLDLLIDEDMVTVRKTYRISFLSEWDTHERLRESGVPTEYVNTFIDSDGSCYLKLFMEDKSKEQLGKRLVEVDRKINDAFYPLIYSNEDDTREKNLIRTLIDKNLTLSCAESYTGGRIISSLIENPHASKIIEEAFIVYSNAAKNEILGVDLKLIDDKGVVSQEVCEAMLDGLYKKTKSSLCIATTGFAGPDGDAGRVIIGIKYNGENYIFEKKLFPSRRFIINKSKNLAIDYSFLIIEGKLEDAIGKIE